MTKLKTLRVATASLAILLVVSGVIGEIRYGGICTFTIQQILAACPLGFLERSLATGELLPQWSIAAALVLLSVILLGRVFCAWVCPAGLVHRVFRGNGAIKPKRPPAANGTASGSYSSYAVLGGVLAASFLFHFPVFCLVCPIGLFFAAFYAAIRFFSLDSFSLELVLFPAMLVLELWVLRSWCRSICPLGALLSLAGNLNRFLLPTLRKEKCLTSKGINCQACTRACPEGINVARIGMSFAPNSCTKCLECYSKCPAGAIKIALVR